MPIENALPFFAIGLLYALTAPTKTAAQAYFFTFLGARLLHSVFYLWAMLGMAFHVIRAAV